MESGIHALHVYLVPLMYVPRARYQVRRAVRISLTRKKKRWRAGLCSSRTSCNRYLGGVFAEPSLFLQTSQLAPHRTRELRHVRASPGHPGTVRLAGRKRHARFESSGALAEQRQQPAVESTAVELHGCCARTSLPLGALRPDSSIIIFKINGARWAERQRAPPPAGRLIGRARLP